MAGWGNSDRRQRLPDNWAELVKLVKIRDGGQCRKFLPSGKRCPRRGTDVDHVIAGDDHRLVNLQLLCAHHHQRKTIEDDRPRRRKTRGANLPKEPHPGLRPR